MSLLENFTKISLADALSAKVEAVTSDEEKALGSQFVTLSPRFSAEPESLVAFNESLKTKTFVSGNTLTAADLEVFVHVLPLAKKWSSVEDLAKFRHVLRWVELLQSRIVDVPAAEQVKIDYDVKLPREIKEKKKPAAKDAAKDAAPAKDSKKAAAAALLLVLPPLVVKSLKNKRRLTPKPLRPRRPLRLRQRPKQTLRPKPLPLLPLAHQPQL